MQSQLRGNAVRCNCVLFDFSFYPIMIRILVDNDVLVIFFPSFSSFLLVPLLPSLTVCAFQRHPLSEDDERRSKHQSSSMCYMHFYSSLPFGRNQKRLNHHHLLVACLRAAGVGEPSKKSVGIITKFFIATCTYYTAPILLYKASESDILSMTFLIAVGISIFQNVVLEWWMMLGAVQCSRLGKYVRWWGLSHAIQIWLITFWNRQALYLEFWNIFDPLSPIVELKGWQIFLWQCLVILPKLKIHK